MLAYYWLFFVFIIGACIGSFLNVCVARLPLEKSVFWPGSRCGACLQPIRWYDNIPLLSYWLLRGRCRKCGARFSIRYFFIELLTALGFVGLFYLEVIANIHDWPILRMARFGDIPPAGWVLFGFHATLFSLLLAAAFSDLEHREIPIALTFAGTVIGLVGAVLWPWPWPHLPAYAMAGLPPGRPWWMLNPDIGPVTGLYPWPVWGPPPDWMPPGSWQLGLATGLAGLLAGTLLLRAVGGIFGRMLGKEAMGLGDADLMMMAGAFLGWQPVVVAFFVSTAPGLVFAFVQLARGGGRTMPFGPALAVGVVLTFLGWPWIGPKVQMLFFWDMMLLALVVVGAVFLALAGLLLRLTRRSET